MSSNCPLVPALLSLPAAVYRRLTRIAQENMHSLEGICHG